MTVHRVMGIETEYGISVPGHPEVNPTALSSRIVQAYAQDVLPHLADRSGWDYDLETPLRDARGFDMSRAEADPTQLTDEPGLANVVLTNGSRLYVDHAHPELSTPEVTNPRDALLWDRAGVEIMRRAMALAGQHGEPIVLYKNNTDNKGSSYGCHENYLMDRRTPFPEIVRHLTPFFISRQVFTGAGRLGIGQEGRRKEYQISQRADFFEVEVGLETTLKRPIINTRDEPHADPEKYRRLHVIVGDANMSDTATFLKLGTTALVLAMLEAGHLDGLDWWPVDPVREMHEVSHDTSLTHEMLLSGGRRRTALQLQSELYELAEAFCAPDMDDDTRSVLDRWSSFLADLAEDPGKAGDRVDWVAKRALMEGFRRREGLSWDAARLQLIDLQYADLRPERGLAAKLEARGRLRRLVTDEEVREAVVDAPRDTRAYFRGECMRRYPESVAAASWDSVVFDLPGREALLRVPILEPLRGTAAMVGDLLDDAPDATSLVEGLLRESR
jgi:proteasome accessory factor PafA2